MIDITIKDFPFPPSVNTHLVPIMSKVGINSKGRYVGKGHMMKSKEHQIYAKKIDTWHKFYIIGINKLIDEIEAERKILKYKFALELDVTLVVHKDRLLKIDTDNYTKATQDNLCRILKFDDRYIFKSTIKKVLSNSGKEYAIIRLKSCQQEDENDARLKYGIKSTAHR